MNEWLEVVTQISTLTQVFALLIVALITVYLGLPKQYRRRPSRIDNWNQKLRFSIAGLFLILTLFFAASLLLTHFWSPSLSERKVKIDARNIPLHMVLQDIAKQIDAVAALKGDFNDPISMTTDSEVGVVMDQICQIKNCDWRIIEGEKPALFVNRQEKGPRP